MRITFTNLTVAIDADTPEAAYARLCETLATMDDAQVEWTSDRYLLGDESRDTAELFR